MPATRRLPRPGPLEVRYGTPIAPPSPVPGEDPVLTLRDQSRQAILRELGEPDLAA
jgi:hypothetical protein